MTTVSMPVLRTAAAAVTVMVLFQLVRLFQTVPAHWFAADYLGRLCGLAVLLAVAPTRALLTKREVLQAGYGGTAMVMIALVAAYWFLLEPLEFLVATTLPDIRLSRVPHATGGLQVLDATAGIALVAVHEELFFRKFARQLLSPICGDGAVLTCVTSALFAIYHWQFGLATITVAFVFGVAAMLVYRRLGSFVPLIVVHYVIDLRYVI